MSGILFGFCMARIVTNIMRIVWATRATDIRVAIAAQIFVSAGVLILFLVNLVFAQRILRAAHPHFGWHKTLSRVFLVMYVLIIVMLVVVITATVQSFYTLNTNTIRIDRDLKLAGSTYFMTISFLPLPMVILGLIVPRKARVENFGSGRWRTKIWILLASSALLSLGSSFRTGTLFDDPRPRADPAWYDAKWCFYVFNFTVELIVVYLYLILRVDHRFHVPNGSKGPGAYSGSNAEKGNTTDTRPESSRSATRILSEEEVFDDQVPEKLVETRDEEGQQFPSPETSPI